MTLSGIINRIMSVPHSIVYAKFLMPSGYGIFQIIKIIINYFSYLQLGVLQGMNRNIPRAYANNAYSKASEIKNLTFTWLFYNTIFGLLVLLLAYFLIDDLNSNLNFVFLLFLVLVIVAGRINAFLKPLLKAEGEFIILAKSSLYRGLITPFIGIFLVYKLSILGAVIALLIDQLFLFLITIYFYRGYKPSFFFKMKLFVDQISVGFLIFLNRFSENIISSFTILLIGFYYDSESVGIFSFGFISLMGVQKYTNPIRIYIYREIMKMKGSENKNNNYYKKLFQTPNILNLFLNVVLLMIFSIVYFILIKLFLNKYLETIPVIYITVFALIFYNARIFYGQFLDATNQLLLRSFLIFIGTLIGLVLTLYFLVMSYDIAYIALSTGLGLILVSLLMIFYASIHVFKNYIYFAKIFISVLLISFLNFIILYFFSFYNFLIITQNIEFINILYVLLDLAIKISVVLILNYILFSILFIKLRFNNSLNNIIMYVYKNLIMKKV